METDKRWEAETKQKPRSHPGLGAFIRLFSEPFVPLSHRHTSLLPAVSIPVHIPKNFQRTISRETWLETWRLGLWTFSNYLMFQLNHPALLVAKFFLNFNSSCLSPQARLIPPGIHAVCTPTLNICRLFCLACVCNARKSNGSHLESHHETWQVTWTLQKINSTSCNSLKMRSLEAMLSSSYITKCLNTKVECSTGPGAGFLTGNGSKK